MVKETWEQILQNQEVRQNLSKLRKEMKEGNGKKAFLFQIAGQQEKLTELLHHEDAKTRKNAAMLMGDLSSQEFLEPIYHAYETEEQMFVKSSYLAAIKNMDYREYLDDMKKRLEQLIAKVPTPENEKHLSEEIRELSTLVVRMEGVAVHTFRGFDDPYDIILLTNRNYPGVTSKKLSELEPDAKIKEFGAGIMARVPNLKWMDGIRTYSELLFVVKGMQSCPMDATQAAEQIVQSELLPLLERAHKGEPPFYFRVELKSRMELDKRSAFTKKMASQIEKLSNRKLINNTSNYELEIRLIENKEGTCNVLVKLFTLIDERFSYRREVVPTSIKPVTAALAVALAGDYLKEGAQVLDPFCGVGTMLTERYKAVHAGSTYGLDIQEDAIEKARVNTKAAHQIVHYINRDFFDFKHDYLFDEIITNMPFRIGRKTEEEIQELYERFFEKAGEHLKADGTMILYSHNRALVKQLAQLHGYRLLQEFEISLKEGTYVMVLGKQ